MGTALLRFLLRDCCRAACAASRAIIARDGLRADGRVFRVTDRWGRDTLLTQDQWSSHIVARRASFSGRASIVADTLTAPAFVNFDKTYPDREVVYRPSPLPHPYGRSLIRVIVRFDAIGEVVTAHLIEKPHREVFWKRP